MLNYQRVFYFLGVYKKYKKLSTRIFCLGRKMINHQNVKILSMAYGSDHLDWTKHQTQKGPSDTFFLGQNPYFFGAPETAETARPLSPQKNAKQ